MSVAIRAITRLQDADDVSIAPGAGTDGYALTYNHGGGNFVLAPGGSGGGGGVANVKIAAAQQAIAQSVGTGTGTRINYDTVDADPDGAITTGASWQFEAPANGHYSFYASAGVQDGGELWIYWYKNGSVTGFTEVGTATFTWNWVGGTLHIQLEAGDIIHVNAVKASGSANTVPSWMRFTALYVVDSGGSSAGTFLELTDTPTDYTGQGGKLVAVKSDGSGLEFIDAPSGGSFLSALAAPVPFSSTGTGLIESAISAL
jgi:hypothetical protein